MFIFSFCISVILPLYALEHTHKETNYISPSEE